MRGIGGMRKYQTEQRMIEWARVMSDSLGFQWLIAFKEGSASAGL
jgi:hypothetical protein